MPRKITLFTGQWADLNSETLFKKCREMGFDGVELACWGDHFDVHRALEEENYCEERQRILQEYQLECFAISNHLVGQAVCDRIDDRHQSILPATIWGDGHPEGVRERAANEMKLTAKAAKKFGVKTVTGFTGSSIWHLLYAFPPTTQKQIEAGFSDFSTRWRPILDEFQNCGVRFALEVHPTEIAFDSVTAERALKAIDHHPAFGFNFDPSHLAYQGVDYVDFIYRFSDRIFNVHMKDVYWSDHLTQSGTFGGHLDFGDPKRHWDFRSLGRGRINFENIIRALNHIDYQGPLSIEWEDSAMDRYHGAKEACEFVRKLDFVPCQTGAFDSAFIEN